eukprot:3515172-Prymnesium_polylepis.1
MLHSSASMLTAALRPRFVPLRCTLPITQHTRVPGGPNDDGKFASEALSRYSERMNQLIAEAIVECIASGKPDPGGAMPSRTALGKAPPANAAKPSAPSNSTNASPQHRRWRIASCRSSMTRGIPSSCIRQITSLDATWRRATHRPSSTSR